VLFADTQETLGFISAVADTVYVSNTNTIRGVECIQSS